MTLFLDEKTIAARVGVDDALDAAEEAFRAVASARRPTPSAAPTRRLQPD